MSYPLLASLAAIALVAGCASSPEQPSPRKTNPSASSNASPEQDNPLQRCNSSAVSALINRQADDALLEQARRQSGAERARMVRPNDFMTMDYDTQRINLYLDAQGRITQISCG